MTDALAPDLDSDTPSAPAELIVQEGLQRQFQMKIEAVAIDKAVQLKLRKLARTARIHGFRPGKAPMNLVEQQYRPQVEKDVFDEQLSLRFNQVAEAHHLRVASRPYFEWEKNVAGDYQAKATFEVMPEIHLGDLTQQTFIRHRFSAVSDAEIDTMLEKICKESATYKHVARAVQKGDQVLIDFVGTIDGQPFQGGSAEGMTLLAGEGQMLPEFDQALLGMKEEQSQTISLTFPADYHGRAVAGKAAEFRITLRSVAQPEIPAVDAELAKTLGVKTGSVETLRNNMRQGMARDAETRLREIDHQMAFNLLLQAAQPLMLPRSLVQMEVQRMYEESVRNLQDQRIDLNTINFDVEKVMPAAQRRVALNLVLPEVVRKQQFKATTEETQAMVHTLIEGGRLPPDSAAWFQEDTKRLEQFQGMVIEQKLIDWIASQARLEERTLGFAEVMALGNEAPPQTAAQASA